MMYGDKHDDDDNDNLDVLLTINLDVLLTMTF